MVEIMTKEEVEKAIVDAVTPVAVQLAIVMDKLDEIIEKEKAKAQLSPVERRLRRA